MVLESNTLDVLFVKDGQQGEDGKILYTWIKYAKDANGTGMTDDPNGAVYIGISYNNESSTESNDPKQYAWTKIQGAEGKKGEDAYTIFLENENISFATDENRNPLSEQAYTSGITIMKGAKPVTEFTIGDIAKTQGIAVAKTDTAIAISVINGNPLPNDSGVIEIPISVGGTVFKKILSWTCSKKGDQGIQGIQGPQGVQGEKGKDGTSVTISNKSITYQLSASGTVVPTGTWQTSPQTIPEGQYQWTKTSVTYSDGNKTESYSISYRGKNGSNGTSVKTTSTSVKYQVGDSGTTKPTGTWQTNVPTVAQGKYLWTQTIVNYSDGNSTESYSVSYKGIDGSNGSNGMNAATVYLYQRATSTPSKPSNTLTYTFSTTKITGTLNNGWSTAIPTGTDAVYVIVASVSSKNDTTTIATSAWSAPVVLAQNGKTGSDGKAGLNVATIYLYQRATSKPSKPSASVTYTFSTGVASGLNNGWSQKIPDGTNPLYVTLATASSNTATDTILSSEWSDVVVMAQNGEDGQDGENGAGFHWNLLSGTKDFDKTKMSIASAASFDSQKYLGLTVIKAVSPTSGYINPVAWNNVIAPTPNTQYTISFYAKASVATRIASFFYPNCTIKNVSNYHTTTASDGYAVTKLSTEWNRYSVTWTTSSSVSGVKNIIPVRLEHGNTTDGATVYFCGVKLEQSDKASPWCTTYEETLAKNLSITPSAQYFKSTDGGKTFAPNTITIKPTIQGEISFGKWQYSIDGGVSFADVVSGQKGLTISNNVLSVSKDSSLYSNAVTMVTFRAVANDSSFYDTCSIAKIYDVSDIGDGRNVLWNSNFAKTDEAITGTTNSWGLHTRGTNLVASIDTSIKHNGFNTLKTVSAANGDKNSSNDLEWFAWGISERTSDNLHPKNQNYTLSFYAKASVATDFIVRWGYDSYGTDTTKTLTTDWQRYEIKLHTATTSHSITIIFKLLTASTVWFSEFKLEKGSSATGYSTAPEDVQTAILSTKSEISSVSSKVDKNTKSIENRVEKTTYEKDLTLVKGDISKANEGLNKWRYEIYPKSLFASEYQGKSTMDVFAKNTNLTPSQSVLINDTDLSIAWNYDNNYIGYALTFAKFSTAKSVAITFAHDDGAHIYLNGKLIGGGDAYNQTGESLTLGFVKGWNCIEVVVNEGASTEGFKLGTTISAISECQLMNCYYGTPVARQSHITNQLVQNTTDIEGISGSVQRVMSTVGDSSNIDEFVNNYSTWKKKVNGIETRVGETYTTKDEFNGLEIGGRNLLTKDDCNMSKWQNLYPAHCKITNNDYSNHIDYVPTGGEWEIIYKKISVTKGQKYILSFDYKVNKAYNYLSGQKYGVYLSTSVPTNAAPANIIANGQYVVENTVTNIKRGMITFTATADTLYVVINGGCIDDNQTGLSFEFNKWKLEKGNKVTDWTPAPEDDEINGQNLVSNLPSNWEQGSVKEGAATGTTYTNTQFATSSVIRPKELIPISGDITISTAYSNQSKKPIRHWIAAYDVNKNYLGKDYVSCAWNSFPRTLNMKDAKYIAVMVGYTDSLAITPSDISQICLKIERGTSATPFTLAPEDVNGKIVNVETIANQTAKEFSWIVKGGDKSSSMVLTDDFLNIVANKINLTGKVTFNSFDKSTQDKLNSPTSGNLITVNPTNPTSNYGNTSFAVTGDDAGGRCIQTTASFVPFTNYASNIFKPGEQIYYNICVPNWSSTTFNANLGIWFFTAEKKCVANSCTSVTLTRTTWNKLSGYITVPSSGWSGIVYYVIGIENPNKYQLGLVSNSYIEKTTSYASTYASSAVNWVTNNGSSTTSLNSMVKKWTDGAVSDTTQINGGWIKANTITASKIALADFTNYSQLTRDTADMYGFTVTDDTDGTWFSTKVIKRDLFISKLFPCNGGESYLIEYDISTNMKASDTASNTKNYRDTAIGVYGYTGDINSNGKPAKATNIWYATRISGSSDAPVTHIKTAITTSTATKQFRIFLQSNGYYFEGTTKIRNLSVRRMYGGTLIVDGSITADKIATDAIKSRNYISSGGTQGSFLNLSDGSFKSPNLSWDSNGNLIATGANLSGQITATDGSIGKFKITKQLLTTGSGSTCTGIGGNQAFWAGAESSNSAPFRVGYDGKFVSSNADITGKITATKGNIGKYEITDTYLKTGSGSTCSGFGSDYAFWAGDDESKYAPFRVEYDGTLNAEHITVHGDQEDVYMKIGKDYLTIQDVNTSAHIGLDGFDFDFANSRIKTGDQGIELYGSTPYIDFHYDNSYSDYTSRIIAQKNWDCLSFTGSIELGADLYANGWIYNAPGGHYTWNNRNDAYISCGNYNNTNNIYYYAGYHAFYVNGDSGSGMMYIETSGVSSRKGFRNSSDERIKQNFSHFDDNFINTYMNLEPVQYQFKNDTNDKYHFGFKAQQTERILNAYGQESDKSYGICATHAIDPEKAEKLYGVKDMHEEYTLAYDELIAPTTYMVQHIYKELTKVKQEKADLEARLQAIEAKLGL